MSFQCRANDKYFLDIFLVNLNDTYLNFYIHTQYLADNISLRPLPCPGGYSLESLNGLMGCTCKDVPEILNCEDDQETILIKVN